MVGHENYHAELGALSKLRPEKMGERMMENEAMED